MAFAVKLEVSKGMKPRGLAYFQRNSELLQSIVIKTEMRVVEEGIIDNTNVAKLDFFVSETRVASFTGILKS